MVLLESFHVDNMFKTCRISDCAPWTSWSITFAGTFIFSLENVNDRSSCDTEDVHSLERDCKHSRTNRCGIRPKEETLSAQRGWNDLFHLPLEWKIVRRIDEWLELRCALVICDTYDRYLDISQYYPKVSLKTRPDLGLFDKGNERSHSSTVTRRHTINFVHDETCSIGYGHPRNVRCLPKCQYWRILVIRMTHILTVHPSIQWGVIDVGTTLVWIFNSYYRPLKINQIN